MEMYKSNSKLFICYICISACITLNVQTHLSSSFPFSKLYVHVVSDLWSLIFATIWTNVVILLIGPPGKPLVKFLSELMHLHARKWIWKYRLENGGHFFSASMCLKNLYRNPEGTCIAISCQYGIKTIMKAWQDSPFQKRLHIFCDAMSIDEIIPKFWGVLIIYFCILRLVPMGNVYWCCSGGWTLQWRRNERKGVSSHQPRDCVLNCLFFSGEYQRKHQSYVLLVFVRSQRASNVKHVPIWWRHETINS